MKTYKINQMTEAEYEQNMVGNDYESNEILVVWHDDRVCMDILADGVRIVPILRKIEASLTEAGLAGNTGIFAGWFGQWADDLRDPIDKKYFIWNYSGAEDRSRGCWSYSWGIEDHDGRWYVFLNLARPKEEQPEQTKEDPEQVTAEIIDWFEEHEAEYIETIEELDDWNGYLSDDRYWNMSDLNDFYCNESPTEILQRAFFGYDGDSPEENRRQFNPMSEYFHFNGYGNLVSSDSKDYSAHLDHWFVESCLEHLNDLWSIKANPELSDLFDRLEAAQNAGREV